MPFSFLFPTGGVSLVLGLVVGGWFGFWYGWDLWLGWFILHMVGLHFGTSQQYLLLVVMAVLGITWVWVWVSMVSTLVSGGWVGS